MNHETNESMGNLSEEELEKMKAEGPPIDDQQVPAEDSGKQPLPTEEPLPVAEQLAHTQTAYQALLEDFEKVSRELAELKDTGRDTFTGLTKQVEDLVDEKLTLYEAVRLKQQVIDRLETRVTDLQVNYGNAVDAYEKLKSDALKAASPRTIDLSSDVLTLRDEVKSLRRQVDDMQEANRIMRRRLQS